MADGLVIDNFAGGGGASTGIEKALGRPVDVAINHDEAAIAVHSANHPQTKHFCQSIYSVDPLDATQGQAVSLVWFSPDCKHHSKAKGGKPRDKNIRDLAWVVPHWIEWLKDTPNGRGAPDVIYLENVEEFRKWGPLHPEGHPEAGMPIKERQGEEFDLWVRRIRRLGYKVEWWELKACDYGAPTSRKRLYLVARRDGKPIVKPAPTHGPPDHPDVLAGKLEPYRTAAECIDWSRPCPSIFDRKKPLGTVVAGGAKHGAVAAFLHKYRPNSDGSAADVPMPTITANSFIKKSGGAAPLALTAAHLEQANTGLVGHDARKPLSTIIGKGSTQRLVETSLVEEGALPPELMERAVRTAAFLVKYYGSEVGQHQAVDQPIDTVTAKPRFAVVTVVIDAVTFVLVDIGMRMLEPRELANAMGFPADYILDPVCWYVTDSGARKFGPLPKAQQIAKIGNAVCPVMAEVLVAANSVDAALGAESVAA